MKDKVPQKHWLMIGRLYYDANGQNWMQNVAENAKSDPRKLCDKSDCKKITFSFF